MTRKEFDQIVYETLVAMGDQDDGHVVVDVATANCSQ